MRKEIIKKTIIAAFVFVVIGSLIGSLVYFIPKRGGEVPVQVKNAMDYINKLVEEQGYTASLVSWKEESGVFRIDLKVGENQYQSFVTKDGKYLFPSAFDLSKTIAKSNQTKEAETQKSQEEKTQQSQVEKRERPDVKLFVMSYCPFGLQMEKALLPAWQLLKEKAEIGIYYVDYIMHGKKEMEENLRQYCIQKEQKEKYLAYLGCFVKDGNSENCLKEAGIDQEKLNSCQKAADEEFKISESFTETGYPPFNVHKDLNEKYGVKGSPTLVINDQVVNVIRSPEKVKQAICNAFLNPPSECQQKLSEETTSAGFGVSSGSAGSGSGKCE
jgi:protein-disulfide isomerase